MDEHHSNDPPGRDPGTPGQEAIDTAALSRAAAEHWEVIAAFAFDHYLTHDRGLVVVDRRDLERAATAADASSTPPSALPMTYIPMHIVPPADDFHALMQKYHPQTDVLLLVGAPGESETVLRLSSVGMDRPSPEACHAAAHRQRTQRGATSGESPVDEAS